MSNQSRFSHNHFSAACDLFKQAHNLSELEREFGLPKGTLHNKFNPASEKHKLSALDLIGLYQATGDDTLFDGLLFDCGLTAVRLPGAAPVAPEARAQQALNAGAQILGVTPKHRRRRLVGRHRAHGAAGHRGRRQISRHPQLGMRCGYGPRRHRRLGDQTMRLRCPHCKSRMTSRTTRPMSLLSFESYQRCSNVECNFRCKVLAEIVAELKPAELRNPAVVLPVVHTAQPIPTHSRPFPAIEALKQAGVAETAAEQEGA